jgi:hypothetical protein
LTEDKKPNDKNAGQIFLEELTTDPEQKSGGMKRFWLSIRNPVLAVFSGLVLSAILIIVTSEEVYAGFGLGLGPGFYAMWKIVARCLPAHWEARCRWSQHCRAVMPSRFAGRLTRSWKAWLLRHLISLQVWL